MGMGFGSNFADVIEFAEVKRLCPAEARALKNALRKYGVGMAALARTFRCKEPELEELRTALCDAAPAELATQELDARKVQGVQDITRALENLKTALSDCLSVRAECGMPLTVEAEEPAVPGREIHRLEIEAPIPTPD